MKWGTIIRRINIMIAIIMVIIVNRPSHAFLVEIENNKISVEANGVPLQDLLKQIAAENDIILRMDRAINPPINASFIKRNLEDGLKAILKPHNYALFWTSNPRFQSHPSEPAYLLSQIHVFRPGEKSQMVNITASFGNPPVETQALLETKVTIKDNKVYVPVTLVYQDREVQTTLLFDTGASSIVLHQNVSDQLEIDDFKESQGRGVGGVQINTRATQLSYVIVGPHKKENLRAHIVEYNGSASEIYNGLLGMNFLRGLKYTIDFENQTIQWNP